MLNPQFFEQVVLSDEIGNILKGRRNLMFYDGRIDGLQENVEFKYFYSSPHEPLEFVNLDVYIKPMEEVLPGKRFKSSGRISIIMDRNGLHSGLIESIFGWVEIKEIKVRGNDKFDIALHLNRKGISDIKNAIIYFEKYLCSKSTS